MSLIAYVRDNLAGAWQVMLGRREGLDRLDTTLEGFWRSFAAVILVAPLAFLALISERPLQAETDAVAPLAGDAVATTGVALLVDWFAFPLIFAFLARPFGLGSRYVPFIVARNWASVIISAIVAVFHALHLVSVLPSALMPYVLLVAVAIALRFSYVVTRTALIVTWAMALPIVIFDFLLSLVIWSVFDRLT
jgi:hypothetical protein